MPEDEVEPPLYWVESTPKNLACLSTISKEVELVYKLWSINIGRFNLVFPYKPKPLLRILYLHILVGLNRS